MTICDFIRIIVAQMRNTNDTIGKIIIKKYSNRRLYYSAEKRYVTFKDISQLIKKGHVIQVIDTQSKEDITKHVLIQTIMDSEKNNQDILPLPFLHKLIRYGSQLSKNYLEKSFIMMMQPYLEDIKSVTNKNTDFSNYKQSYNSENDLKEIHIKMEELEEKIRQLSN